jgi:NADH dehydrogenase
MILVAGGTGLLGRNVVARLVGRGLSIRVLTRDLELARGALGPFADRVELVEGDVRNIVSLGSAVAGADTVIAAVQGFGGREAGGIAAVDRDGNRNLVRVAAAAGVERFVLLSIHDASAADPLALGRVKATIEANLRATSMTPLIIRPTAYMETWAGVVGGPIVATGRARVFGRGQNPINFVASDDVAAVVEEVVVDRAADGAGRRIEVVGPEDLSFDDVVARFADALGRPVFTSHVPLPMLRAMAVVLRPFKPILAAQVAAAVVLDTTDRTARDAASDPASVRRGTIMFETVITRFVAASHSEEAPARA